MILSTLCYLERDGKYLMLHRVVKKNDVNKDKWIGIGGKFEAGESPEDCLLREAMEETGYRLTSFRLRGLLTFLYNGDPAEYIFLYTADGFEGTAVDCDEGTLEWVSKEEIDKLNLWEGDRIFFDLLNQDAPFFSLKLEYNGNRLVSAALDGRPLELYDVLLPDGTPSGLTRERTILHRHGDFHRASHVWIARKGEDGSVELLLQKRAASKDSFPGCYDISSAGHVAAGEEFLSAAVRELEEELGITARPEDLRFAGYHEEQFEQEFHGQVFRNHELGAVYVYEKPVDENALPLQKSEVESVRWMRLADVDLAAREHDPAFCIFPDETELLRQFFAGEREG